MIPLTNMLIPSCQLVPSPSAVYTCIVATSGTYLGTKLFGLKSMFIFSLKVVYTMVIGIQLIIINTTLQIFYYSTDIFDTAGVKQSDIATILVGVVLVTVTILSVSYYSCYAANNYIMVYQVFLVERLGRKTLMLYGLGGMAVSFTLTTICFCFQVNHNPYSIMNSFMLCKCSWYNGGLNG